MQRPNGTYFPVDFMLTLYGLKIILYIHVLLYFCPTASLKAHSIRTKIITFNHSKDLHEREATNIVHTVTYLYTDTSNYTDLRSSLVCVVRIIRK